MTRKVRERKIEKRQIIADTLKIPENQWQVLGPEELTHDLATITARLDGEHTLLMTKGEDDLLEWLFGPRVHLVEISPTGEETTVFSGNHKILGGFFDLVVSSQKMVKSTPTA